MKFQFSLASVLRVRKHQEKIQKQKLAEEVSKKNEIKNIRDSVKRQLENYVQNAQGVEAENIHVIRRRSQHMEEVHQQMDKLADELDEAQALVSKERDKLAAAHKNRHILEKVREFEQKIFTKKVAQNEQKFMDEIAAQNLKSLI